MGLFSENDVIRRRIVAVVGVGVGRVDGGDCHQVTDLKAGLQIMPCGGTWGLTRSVGKVHCS